MSDAGSEPEAPADPRPRPQYGEYATAEEQRARIRQPYATEALLSGQALDTPAAATESTPASSPAPAPSAPRSAWRLADLIVTIVLLSFGLFYVAIASSQYFALADSVNRMLEVFSVDARFTDVAGARLWGSIGGAVLIAGWLLTAFISWRQLRRGRIAFWIPIAGALVFGLAVSLLVSVPLVGDPAFTELVDRFSS